MTDRLASKRTPLVLLANHQEWTARSVESVLRPAGYAVVKAYTGRQATELTGRFRPDLVIVDYRLSDGMGLDVCNAIRDMPTVDRATPFIVATGDQLSRKERHECFKAGIWDIFTTPFDPVELVGKLDTFLGARRQAEEAWEFTHKDPATGLYNWNGLLTRAVELIADARRNARWTACIALGPKRGEPVGVPEGLVADSSDAVLSLFRGDIEPATILDRLTHALREGTRDADSRGILGSNDFLVLAPGTDEEGAAILAGRLVEALNDQALFGKRQPEGEWSAGYYAAQDETGGSLVAEDLLGRTMEALRTAQHATNGTGAVLPFHPA